MSDTIISETKVFLSIFLLIFEIYIKFWTFWKKEMTLIADVFPKLHSPKKVII